MKPEGPEAVVRPEEIPTVVVRRAVGSVLVEHSSPPVEPTKPTKRTRAEVLSEPVVLPEAPEPSREESREAYEERMSEENEAALRRSKEY